MTCWEIVLINKTTIIENPYTKFLLLYVNYNTSSEYINPMSTRVFGSQNYDVCVKTG